MTQKIFTITVSGIPTSFTTSAAAPASVGGITYTPSKTLDMKSIKLTKDKWNLRAGTGTPGTLRARLVDTDGALGTLFATDLLTAQQTPLMHSLPVSGGTGEAVQVYDHAAFGASGLLYIGLETVSFDGKVNAGGAVPYDYFDDVARALYGSPGYAHVVYSVEDPGYQSNPIVSDHPYLWAGRFLTLTEYTYYPDTASVSTARTIWRGYLREVTQESDGTFSFLAVSLLDVLTRKIGRTQGQAEASTVAVDPATWVEVDQTDPYMLDDIFYYADPNVENNWMGIKLHWSDGTVDTLPFHMGVSLTLEQLTVNARAATYGFFFCLDFDSGDPRVRAVNTSTGGHSVQMEFMEVTQARALGFDSTVYQIDHPGGTNYVDAERTLSRTFHSARTGRIYIQNSSIVLPTGISADSPMMSDTVEIHCTNSDGETREIVRVESIGTDVYGTYLELKSRAGVGIDVGGGPVSFALWTDEPDKPISIKQCLAAEQINGGMLLMYLLCSFDGSGYNGDWDLAPQGWGAELPSAFVAEEHFIYGGAAIDAQRWALDEEMALSDIAKAILQAAGLGLTCDQGRLKCFEVGICDVASATAITDAAGLVLLPQVGQNADLVVNAIKPSYAWSYRKQEYLRKSDTITDIRAASWQTGWQTMTLEHRGLWRGTDEESKILLEDIGADLFNRFGVACHTITFEMQEWAFPGMSAGASILLTMAGAYNPGTGARGVSGLACAVLEVEADPVKGTYKVTVILVRQSRAVGPWAPALKVASWNAGNGNLTVEANEYSYPLSLDYSFFSVNDVIVIYRESDESITIQRTITAVWVSGITITAGTLLSDGNPPAAGDRVRFDDWSNVVARQKTAGAFIADESDKLLEATDPPFFWE